MFSRYLTEGIFLKKYQRFDSDQHLIAYTKDFGKIGLTGKSIRKMKSKLKSNSELFCYSEIEFIRGRNYNILTDSSLINLFSATRKDLGKLSVAFKLANLVESFLPEEEKEEKLWDFISDSFILLNDYNLEEESSLKIQKLQSFYYYFSFKFLDILGYRPEIGDCMIDKNQESLIFSPREGGLICQICSKNVKDPFEVKITEEDKIFLKAVSDYSFKDFLSQNFSFRFLEDVLKNYIALLPSKDL